MKCFPSTLIVCVLALLLFFTSVESAPQQQRDVKVIPESAPTLDSRYNQIHAVIIDINANDKLSSLECAVKEAQVMGEEFNSLDKKRLEEDKRGIAKEQATSRDLMKIALATPSEIAWDGRFIAFDNGTVLDTQTNLMWAAKDNGANINWQDAKNYCKNYRGGGYTDWQMPTQDELAELYDETITNVNLPADDCGGGYHLTNLIHLTCCCPWASETRGSTAAYFGFSNGSRHWLDQSYMGSTRVLPVRSVK